jgi:hypothetical protein
VRKKFRSIVSTRIFYKIVVSMLLIRMDPEEQHGFRPHYKRTRIIAANVVIECYRQVFRDHKQIWIASLDLSKVFDRNNWVALWLSGYPSVTMASHSIWFGQCNAYIRARREEL